MQQKHKIIGIGFHKTGLSSLKLALEILGYSTIKGQQAYKGLLSEQEAIQKLEEKAYRDIFSYIEPYQAIVDNPWNILFEEIDQHFSNSKFILTTRNEDNWLRSAKGYFRNRPNKAIRTWIYGYSAHHINDSIYLNRYRRHQTLVKKYFENREEDLLVMDIEAGDGWEKLCPFLNKPIINLPFPKQNKNLI